MRAQPGRNYGVLRHRHDDPGRRIRPRTEMSDILLRHDRKIVLRRDFEVAERALLGEAFGDEKAHALTKLPRELGGEDGADALLLRRPLRPAGEIPSFRQPIDPENFAGPPVDQRCEFRRMFRGIDQLLERRARVPKPYAEDREKKRGDDCSRRDEGRGLAAEDDDKKQTESWKCDLAPSPEIFQAAWRIGGHMMQKASIAGDIMNVQDQGDNAGIGPDQRRDFPIECGQPLLKKMKTERSGGKKTG